MVITPEFGPRVRFSKIFTSLPMEIDIPKALGIKEYCHSCTKCASACPPKALPFGEPDLKKDSSSTIKGVKKWSANCEKCFGYWAKIRTDCAICMRVCPFNREYLTFTDKLWRRLATSSFRKLAILWEDFYKPRKRLKPSEWWR
jgi:epoxyqueuosine reductase QueG